MTPAALIQRFEACELTAYQDKAGRWTIGWGCTGPGIVEGLVWTQAQADAELQLRLGRLRADLGVVLKVGLSADQYAAVCSLVWNIGLGAFETSTVLRKLNAGDFVGAASAWVDHATIFDKEHVNGVLTVDPELAKRRWDEHDIFCGIEATTPPGGTQAAPPEDTT